MEQYFGIQREISVVSDEAKPRQILINLLGNAVKFTEKGGVSLRTTAPAASGGPRLAIEVKDSGFGIADDDIENIFKPLEQIEARRQKNEGSGLGLAISRTYARRKAGGWPGMSR